MAYRVTAADLQPLVELLRPLYPRAEPFEVSEGFGEAEDYKILDRTMPPHMKPRGLIAYRAAIPGTDLVGIGPSPEDALLGLRASLAYECGLRGVLTTFSEVPS